MNTINQQMGFTLIEIMIVVAIIGVLAAIAYPSYQNNIISTKRGDMMSEMQNIATNIESQKLAQGSYKKVQVAKVFRQSYSGGIAKYPSEKEHLYNVSIAPVDSTKSNLQGSKWKITATPVTSGRMASDGTLTLNYAGQKCRGTQCGLSDEWRK